MNEEFIRLSSQHLKRGKLISVKVNNQVYQSQIEEVRRDSLHLSAPVKNGRVLTLDEYSEVRVYLSIKKDNYSFVSPILKCIDDPKPVIVLSRPKQLRKFEQRLWERIPAVLKISYSLIIEDNSISAPVRTKTIDVSGGGVLVKADQKMPLNQLLKLILTLPTGRKVSFNGKVVRTTSSSMDSKGSFKTAVEITDISIRNREHLMRFIYLNNHREIIVNRLISSIEKCKHQVFDIYENAEREYKRVKTDIIKNSTDLLNIVDQVDKADAAEAGGILNQQVRDYLVQSILELEHHSEYNRELVEKAEMLTGNLGIILKFMNKELESLKKGIEKGPDNKEIVWRIINAQEEERKRIARDIHDGPAQVLANIFMHLDYCHSLWSRNQEQVGDEIKKLKDTVRENLNDLRKIIFDLRPRSLDELGLVYSLERYFSEFEKQNQIKIQFKHQGLSDSLGPLLNVTIFRITQEALNNARKHANATEISISLKVLKLRLDLEISDNGRGFQTDGREESKEKSFGLGIMQERVKILSGDISIQSKEGRGTRIVVKVPLNN